jgi:TRAP-type C4-dicarboxylate transport system substrate-binding protein
MRSLSALGLLALGLLVCSLMTLPAAAQTPIVLKLSHFLGPTSFFEVDFAQPWARELEARTNGRVHVEIYNAATPFGGVTQQAAQVTAGTIDIALGLRGAESDRFPRSSIVELPFVVKDSESGSRILWQFNKDGGFGNEYGGYKLLALTVHNPGLIHTASKRVETLQDIKGLRFRVPNKAVAAALQQLGAVPVILQVNDVMQAVQAGRLDGIVTNWGNPLVGFNDYMKFHTNVAFYSSVFFVVMNKAKFDSLPPEVRAAIDAQSNEALVSRFGLLWNKWDAPVRDGATGPGQEIITPTPAEMADWRAGLQPVADKYLDGLIAAGITDARTIYQRLVAKMPH